LSFSRPFAKTASKVGQLPTRRTASQDVVEIERSAGYAERIITRSIDRAGRG
jgi:hypothetical protein